MLYSIKVFIFVTGLDDVFAIFASLSNLNVNSWGDYHQRQQLLCSTAVHSFSDDANKYINTVQMVPKLKQILTIHIHITLALLII